MVRVAILLTIAALAAATGGCASGIATSNAVYGPYPNEPQAALFERVVQRVRGRGYVVLDEDVTAGHFAVRSRATDSIGQRAAFRFRFYRGGWVGVEIGGGGAHRTVDGRTVLPRQLHQEYAQLVSNLLGNQGSGPMEARR